VAEQVRQTWERADFEQGSHTFSAEVAWNIRLNIKQNCNQLACIAPLRHSQGACNHQWTLLSPCMQTWSESESCYHGRTKPKINSFGPQNGFRSHLTASEILKIFLGGVYPQTPLASLYTTMYALGYKYLKPDQCNFASAGPAVTVWSPPLTGFQDDWECFWQGACPLLFAWGNELAETMTYR